MAPRPVEGGYAPLSAGRQVIHKQEVHMTKAEEIFTRVNSLMESGLSRADGFQQVAGELGIKVNSARGSYYSYSRNSGNGKSRPRRRETTPEDALADARAALERSIAAIDREVEAAQERATEAAAEAKELKASAVARKQAITERLEALR
jgi:predicted  nucleic acid-binding Zn-ribbon protein